MFEFGHNGRALRMPNMMLRSKISMFVFPFFPFFERSQEHRLSRLDWLASTERITHATRFCFVSTRESDPDTHARRIRT